jgi:hypothetical protein
MNINEKDIKQMLEQLEKMKDSMGNPFLVNPLYTNSPKSVKEMILDSFENAIKEERKKLAKDEK